MKRIALIVLFLSFTVVAFSGQPQSVAVVDGTPIEIWQARREMASLVSMSSYHRNISAERRETLKDEALQSLILKQLKYQWAIENGIEAAEGEAEINWKKIRDRFPDEPSYRAALARQGSDHASFLAAFNRDAVAAAVDRWVAESAPQPSRAEVEGFFSAHRSDYVKPEARHLIQALVYVAPTDSAATISAAEEKAKAALQRVNAGETTVAAEAARLADALPPRYREQCGDLGLVHRGILQGDLEESVFAAEAGEIVGPMRSLLGFHVIQVVSVTPPKPMALEDVREAVNARMVKETRKASAERFEIELRAAATVEVFPWIEEDR